MSHEVYTWGARAAFAITLFLLLIGVLQYLDVLQVLGQPFVFAFIFGLLGFSLRALGHMLGGGS